MHYVPIVGENNDSNFVDMSTGMREVSRRLMRMNFVDAVSSVRRVGNLPTNVDFGETLVQQVSISPTGFII